MRPAAHRWQVVSEPADPVPGDPDEVAKLGRDLRKTADAIRKEAREIKALASVENWKGKTATGFRDAAEDTGDKLRKAFDRYDTAAEALGTSVKEGCTTEYASELHRAQEKADKALVDAEQAEDERSSAQKSLDAHHDGGSGHDSHRKKLEGRVGSAEDTIRAAERAVEAAKRIRDDAANAAAEAIKGVIDDDGLKDGWTDKFQNWVKENSGWLKKISKWAGQIAAWAGALSLALGWIPLVGQAIAAIADAVALVAGVVALATDLVLVLGGQGSWKTVILDAVGIATFGVGRAAMAGAKGASAGAKAVARSNLYKAARAAGKNENKAWKVANRGSQGSVRGGDSAQAMAAMPKGKLPGPSALKDGFNPKSIYRDTVDDVKTIKTGMAPFKAPHSPSTLLNPDLARAADGIRKIDSAALRMPDVRSASSAFSGQASVWNGSTGVGIVAGFEGAYGSVTDSYNYVTGG